MVENHAKPPGRIIKNSQGSLPPSESSWSVCQPCRKCSRHIGFPSDVCLRLEAFDDFHLLTIIKPYTNWFLAHGFDNNNWYNNQIFQHFNVQPLIALTPGFSNRPQGQEALQSSVVWGEPGWISCLLLRLLLNYPKLDFLVALFWSIESLPLGVTYLLHPPSLHIEVVAQLQKPQAI